MSTGIQIELLGGPLDGTRGFIAVAANAVQAASMSEDGYISYHIYRLKGEITEMSEDGIGARYAFEYEEST